uniref:Uncharacterized protein n=1 Tax=Arundo donax TaxID=35708 RepID=A0A0A9GBR1_ARUDO
MNDSTTAPQVPITSGILPYTNDMDPLDSSIQDSDALLGIEIAMACEGSYPTPINNENVVRIFSDDPANEYVSTGPSTIEKRNRKKRTTIDLDDNHESYEFKLNPDVANLYKDIMSSKLKKGTGANIKLIRKPSNFSVRGCRKELQEINSPSI